MQFFLRFWYLQSFSWTLDYYQKTIGAFEAQIAVKATWQNMGKPLFQDYTFQGKIIGFFFRILRIFFGLLLYAILAVITALLYVFWLLFPLLCFISIVGYFFGSTPAQFAANVTNGGIQ